MKSEGGGSGMEVALRLKQQPTIPTNIKFQTNRRLEKEHKKEEGERLWSIDFNKHLLSMPLMFHNHFLLTT